MQARDGGDATLEAFLNAGVVEVIRVAAGPGIQRRCRH